MFALFLYEYDRFFIKTLIAVSAKHELLVARYHAEDPDLPLVAWDKHGECDSSEEWHYAIKEVEVVV